MADVRTSLVGENDIAGRKKVITGLKKLLLGEKCIVLKMTQFIQKINKKITQKNSPTKVSEVGTTSELSRCFFVMAPLSNKSISIII